MGQGHSPGRRRGKTRLGSIKITNIIYTDSKKHIIKSESADLSISEFQDMGGRQECGPSHGSWGSWHMT